MTPRVWNKARGDYPASAVYVGRPSKWGNPYRLGKGDRAEVIAKFREWLLSESGLDVAELRGKDLVCWCAPRACHADVLLELANK